MERWFIESEKIGDSVLPLVIHILWTTTTSLICPRHSRTWESGHQGPLTNMMNNKEGVLKEASNKQIIDSARGRVWGCHFLVPWAFGHIELTLYRYEISPNAVLAQDIFTTYIG